jgi:hypothetical protein
VLKSVFEITGGLPILVWENEGGACARESKSAKPIRSEETFYLHNLTNKTLTRPDRLDGSDCPDVGWTSPIHRNVYKIGKRSKSH